MSDWQDNPVVPEWEELEAAVYESMFGLTSPGFCLACSNEVHGVEPDAQCYRCEGCGEHAVFGAEEVLARYG